MPLAFYIIFGTGSLVWLFFLCEIDDIVKELWGRRKSIKNSKFLTYIQPHVRRIQKMEKDAQQALEAIKNLNETKKRLNKDFQDDWDSQYRLLLPPPENPKGRAPLIFKTYGDFRAFDRPEYTYVQTKGVRIDRTDRLVPLGALKSRGYWWYAFNNIPGHPHKLMFIQMSCFLEVSPTYWLNLPELHRIEGTENEWTWPRTTSGVMIQNLKESVKSLVS